MSNTELLERLALIRNAIVPRTWAQSEMQSGIRHGVRLLNELTGDLAWEEGLLAPAQPAQAQQVAGSAPGFDRSAT